MGTKNAFCFLTAVSQLYLYGRFLVLLLLSLEAS